MLVYNCNFNIVYICISILLPVITIQDFKLLFSLYKEQNLSGRYIHNEHILPLLDLIKNKFEIKNIGKSVLKKPIFSVEIGNGSKRILMWSQMHGNESTTTKAVFDLLNTFLNDSISKTEVILEACTICIIPILNPDGAEAYTRLNANEVDLNRDAQNLTQPESFVLREVFKAFKPHFCFNLHGQRTIFSAGNTNNSATVSFLSPAQDAECTLTDSRKIAMEIIVAMNRTLQLEIPNQVGVYDDSFNINCVGDTFQSLNIPTILFEAGHYVNDYDREKTRELIYQSLLTALFYISDNEIKGDNYKDYLSIPENDKLFFDIILREASLDGKILDVAVQFKEVLKNGKIEFVPTLKDTGNLKSYFGHREIKMGKKEIRILKFDSNEAIEIDIVKKNSEFLPINLTDI